MQIQLFMGAKKRCFTLSVSNPPGNGNLILIPAKTFLKICNAVDHFSFHSSNGSHIGPLHNIYMGIFLED